MKPDGRTQSAILRRQCPLFKVQIALWRLLPFSLLQASPEYHSDWQHFGFLILAFKLLVGKHLVCNKQQEYTVIIIQDVAIKEIRKQRKLQCMKKNSAYLKNVLPFLFIYYHITKHVYKTCSRDAGSLF